MSRTSGITWLELLKLFNYSFSAYIDSLFLEIWVEGLCYPFHPSYCHLLYHIAHNQQKKHFSSQKRALYSASFIMGECLGEFIEFVKII